MTKPSKRVSRIRRIDRLLSEVYHLIVEATPSQRRSLRKSVDRLTTTNCSWILYQARPQLRDMMRTASPQRRHD